MKETLLFGVMFVVAFVIILLIGISLIKLADKILKDNRELEELKSDLTLKIKNLDELYKLAITHIPNENIDDYFKELSEFEFQKEQ